MRCGQGISDDILAVANGRDLLLVGKKAALFVNVNIERSKFSTRKLESCCILNVLQLEGTLRVGRVLIVELHTDIDRWPVFHCRTE